ncbi:MAG: GreA/GreB family elongation factor, partial [Mesobacillus sp.]
VEDVANDERISFYIISPFSSNQEIDEYENCASYLSPVGKALLLKEPGDQVIVETPSMIQEYRIKSFRFP